MLLIFCLQITYLRSATGQAATAKQHRLLQQQRVAGLISILKSGRGSDRDEDRMLNEGHRR